MQRARLITKYRFLENEFSAFKKLTGIASEKEAEIFLDKMDEEKRDTFLSTIAFFTGQNDKIRSKIHNNSSNI